jgi:hypothetical protein
VEIRLLKKGYKNNEQFYKDFLEDQLKNKDEYFSGDVVYINEAPEFPIYIATGNEIERKQLFLQAFEVISKYYLNTDRDIHFEELFWHSLLTVYKRNYLFEQYPQIRDGINYFNNIVIKDFNWENYIYKCILGAQYVNDNISDEGERKKYYGLIIDNLDLFNYIIKYEIFRNDKFLINVLGITDELDLSTVLKSKIKGRDDLGKDERVGRRVIFEFNKSYPIIMSPMMEKEELKEIFLKYLSRYCDGIQLKMAI